MCIGIKIGVELQLKKITKNNDNAKNYFTVF